MTRYLGPTFCPPGPRDGRAAEGEGGLAPSRGRHRGFTLVELLISVSIVGILAAVAVPSYRSYVQKASRADAKSVLMENAQFLERYFSTNNTYTSGTLLSAVVPKGATGSAIRYNITFSVTPSASGYTLSAAPANGQTGDSCGTLTLSHTGAQSPSTGGCW